MTLGGFVLLAFNAVMSLGAYLLTPYYWLVDHLG